MKKISQSAFKPLDDYEKRLMKDIENNEFIQVKNQKQIIKKYRDYFKKIPKKDQRITLRIASGDLRRIKNKAALTGLPYQTLITLLIKRYIDGKINLSF